MCVCVSVLSGIEWALHIFDVLCICVFCFLPLPFRLMFLFSFQHTAFGGGAWGIQKNKTHNCCCIFCLMYVSAETSGQLLREWNKWIRHFYLTKPSTLSATWLVARCWHGIRPYKRIQRQHNFCCKHISIVYTNRVQTVFPKQGQTMRFVVPLKKSEQHRNSLFTTKGNKGN